MAYGYTTLRQQVLDIPVAQVEPVIEPNSVTNNFRWESMAFVCIHARSMNSWRLTCQYRAALYRKLSVGVDAIGFLSLLVSITVNSG